MHRVAFRPPRDHVVLETNDDRVVALAERLWAREPGAPTPSAIRLRIEVGRVAGEERAAQPVERGLFWLHEASEFRCGIPGSFEALIDLEGAEIAARADPDFLARDESLAARTLLEAPVAVLLARRGWRALHAGAVRGPKGTAVLRGGSGAGKSTLVAAAYESGLDVLGDESVLVSRADSDALASSVRELTLLEDAAHLLRVHDKTTAAYSGGENKRRIDLFAGSSPSLRSGRRIATILLGPRLPGPARLATLTPAEFLSAFARGGIPQEGVDGGVSDIARAWAAAGSLRLDGASDLPGAIALFQDLLGFEP